MNNRDNVERLIEEVKNDAELLAMKEELQLSEKVEEEMLEAFVKRAELLDERGIYVPYEDWKLFFTTAADSISTSPDIESLIDKEEEMNAGSRISSIDNSPRIDNRIIELVNRVMYEESSIDIPENMFDELNKQDLYKFDKDGQLEEPNVDRFGGGGRHF